MILNFVFAAMGEGVMYNVPGGGTTEISSSLAFSTEESSVTRGMRSVMVTSSSACSLDLLSMAAGPRQSQERLLVAHWFAKPGPGPPP